MENKDTILNLDNTYTSLPESFYSEIDLSPVKSPSLVIFNEELANSLGIDITKLKTK